jgi:hypothetical protein
MENCARTARAAGVFKEFHVLADRPLEGCECYDAYQCDKAQGLFKLHYLKVGMSRLNFEFFIWLDADSVFVHNPVDILGVLGRSPIHVPLELNLANLPQDAEYKGISCFKVRDLLVDAGVLNQPYLSHSAFWIVRRDAIDAVYDLAFQFVSRCRDSGVKVGVDAALGYAMQLLCADPEAHLLTKHPDVWAGDEAGGFEAVTPPGQAWPWRHPIQTEPMQVRPALVHVPRLKTAQNPDQNPL